MTHATPARLGRVVSLQRSPGGVPKLAVPEARVTAAGLEGDWQNDRKHHGGPDRALCLYALECLEVLAREGHAVGPGALGENVTLAGIDWSAVTPGARLRLGEEVLAEVTGYAAPCRTIAHCFADGRFARVSEKVHPGVSRVYARVLREGTLRAGDVAALEPRGPEREGGGSGA